MTDKKEKDKGREPANPWEYTAKRRVPTEEDGQRDANRTVTPLAPMEKQAFREMGIKYDKDGRRI